MDRDRSPEIDDDLEDIIDDRLEVEDIVEREVDITRNEAVVVVLRTAPLITGSLNDFNQSFPYRVFSFPEVLRLYQLFLITFGNVASNNETLDNASILRFRSSFNTMDRHEDGFLNRFDLRRTPMRSQNLRPNTYDLTVVIRGRLARTFQAVVSSESCWFIRTGQTPAGQREFRLANTTTLPPSSYLLAAPRNSQRRLLETAVQNFPARNIESRAIVPIRVISCTTLIFMRRANAFVCQESLLFRCNLSAVLRDFAEEQRNALPQQALLDVRSSAINIQNVDSNSINIQKVHSNAINVQNVDSNSINTQNVDSNSINTQNIDSNSINTQNVDSNSINTQNVDSNSINIPSVDSNSINTQNVDSNSSSRGLSSSRNELQVTSPGGAVALFELQCTSLPAGPLCLPRRALQSFAPIGKGDENGTRHNTESGTMAGNSGERVNDPGCLTAARWAPLAVAAQNGPMTTNALLKFPTLCSEDAELRTVDDANATVLESPDHASELDDADTDDANCNLPAVESGLKYPTQCEDDGSVDSGDNRVHGWVSQGETEMAGILSRPIDCEEDRQLGVGYQTNPSASSTVSAGNEAHCATWQSSARPQTTMHVPRVVVFAQCEEDAEADIRRQLREENRRLRTRLLCSMCMISRWKVVLDPCGHLLCNRCYWGETVCPFCLRQVRLAHPAILPD